MESQVENGNGRVTRSLRKRLTSVDSNQSNSRPGTPVAISKLAVVNESVVESPRRATRRNSVSTPSGTPVRNTRAAGARGETPEPITPARRITRRRSLSISKDEESTTTVKSARKQKVFDALPEEDDAEKPEFNVQVKVTRIKSEPISPSILHDEKENTPVINVEDIKTPEPQVVHHSKSRSSLKMSSRPESLEKSSNDKSLMNKSSGNAPEEEQNMKVIPCSTEEKSDIVRAQNEKEFESIKDTSIDNTGSSVKKQHCQSIEIDSNEKTPTAKKRLSSALKTPQHSPTNLQQEKKDYNTESNLTSNKEINHSMETSPLRNIEKTNKPDDRNNSLVIENVASMEITPKQESNRRITRSQSKSPNIVKNTKEPNKKQEGNASHEDTNTFLGKIVVDCETPNKDANNEIITITSDDENVNEKSLLADKSKVVEIEEAEPMDVDETMSILVVNSDDENPTDLELEKKQINNQKSLEDINMSVTTAVADSELEKKQAISTPPVITSVIYLPPITQNTMGNLLSQGSQQTAVTDDNVKSVVFGGKDVEKEQKIVYPKTPAPHKTRKHFQKVVVPKPEEHDRSDASFESAVGSLVDEEQIDIEIDKDLDNILEEAGVSVENSNTPIKPKFIEAVVQSSTPILKPEDNIIVSSTVVEAAIEPNATTEEPSNVEPIFNRSWNHNIHGSVKPGDKIDTIESIKELLVGNKAKLNLSSHDKDNDKLTVEPMEGQDDKEDGPIDKENQSEESIEQEVVKRNDEDEDEELSESEKPYKRSEFVEDEAEEVNSYQSGDSMDSEERREVEENEIVDHGESVGSDDDSEGDVEDDEEYEKDSFLVSDSSHLEYSTNESNSEVEEKKKKVPRKRFIVSSSDEDDNEEKPSKEHDSLDDKPDKENDSPKEQSPEAINEPTDVIRLDQSNCSEASKLSETANKLKDDEEDSESSKDEHAALQLNASRKDILRSMNKSDRFNKTVHEMNIDAPDDSPEQAENNKSNMSMKSKKQVIEDNVTEATDEAAVDSVNQNLDSDSLMLSESVTARKSDTSKSKPRLSNQNLSNAEITSIVDHSSTEDEQSKSAADSSSDDSDDEATPEPTKKSSKRGSKILSRSFGGNMLPQTTEERLFHSFTIDVKVANPDSDTKRKHTKTLQLSQTDEPVCDVIRTETESDENEEFANLDNEVATSDAKLLDEQEAESEKDAEFSSCEDQNESVDSEEKEQLEKLSHLKVLFNPLQKSKRQSLYLPNSGEQEDKIENNRKRRKSICQLSSNEFNPSQSFIETVAQRFEEHQRLRTKRKRLSKSFCASDSMTQDLDVKHVHKKSKTVEEYSDEEQDMSDVEEVESPKTQKIESPKAKQKLQQQQHVHGNDSNNNTDKILQRCDEILEAANRAALELKIKNKMNKVNKPKRQKIKTQTNVASDILEATTQASAVSLKKKIKRLTKEKTAVKIALQAAQDILYQKDKPMNIEKQQPQKKDTSQQQTKSKRAKKTVNIISSESSSSATPSSSSSSDCEIHKIPRRQIIKTSAGYVVEKALSPKKPRYIEIFRMPTGIIRVEPATPPHQSFHEEPISPYSFRPAGQGGGRRKHFAGASKMAKWHVSEKMTECKAKPGGTHNRKESKGGRQVAAATATEAALNFKRQKLNKF